MMLVYFQIQRFQKQKVLNFRVYVLMTIRIFSSAAIIYKSKRIYIISALPTV